MHSMYGFQQECQQKYDKALYEAFNAAFSQLPIGVVVNGAILVVHGGIDNKVTLESMRAAPRADYVVNACNFSDPAGGGRSLMARHPMMMKKMDEIRKRDEQFHPINGARHACRSASPAAPDPPRRCAPPLARPSPAPCARLARCMPP